MVELNAEDLKLELGVRAKTIIADGLGLIENSGKKALCPLHADKNPSMSWYKDGLMWRCHACKEHIDIYRYLTEFRSMTFTQAVGEVARIVGKSIEPVQAVVKPFDLPNIEIYELTEPFIEYMAKRKITKETLDFWKVKQSNWKGKEVYTFQYFDQHNKLIYVSYRECGKGGSKGGCETNTKSILWGMWHVDNTKPLCIVEGQPDCAAVWQSGFKNVVSVPNGSNNLKWIDHCWDWLQSVPEFIVFADNDAPGIEMAENIKRRLNNVKIVKANRKDANEVLFYDGPDAILELINEALEKTPHGIIDVAETPYKTAMQVEEHQVETGFIDYDYHVEDWKDQEITVVFGRNGEGKTTFISQVIAHCIQNNEKVFLYSGEMSDNKIQNWLYRQMIGTNKQYLRTIVTKYKDKVEPLPAVVKAIKTWHKGKFFLFDRNERKVLGDLKKFFDTMEIASKRYGIKLFIIDNLMAVLEENADSLYSDQANFVQRCKDFAINQNCHVVLLAHPNKEKKEVKKGSEGNLEKTDISGSNNIPNKADNIIAIERVWDEEGDCDAIITCLKDRESGQRKAFKYLFSRETLRFYNDWTKENVVYGWEKYLK